jgi:hypothetical protein
MHNIARTHVLNRFIGYALAIGGLAVGLSDCGSDTATAPVTPAQAFWSVSLNQHAVSLALTPGENTIQLHAVPLNANGDSLAGLGAVRYTAGDSSVTVDSNGFVTAQYTSSGNQSFVVASLTDTAQRVTLADTCFIQVTTTAPAVSLATFSIQPLAGDSAITSVNGSYTIRAHATDTDDNDFTSMITYFSVSDPTMATIDRLTGKTYFTRTGHITFYATTWAYGVARQDSLPFTVIAPSNAQVSVLAVTPTGSKKPTLTFWPSVVTIGAGGSVYWANNSKKDSIDVIFDDPTHVETDTAFVSALADLYGYTMPVSSPGNIAPFFADTTGKGAECIPASQRTEAQDSTCKWISYNSFSAKRYRLFPVSGTYHYHSTISGATGTIVVQ